MPARRSKQPQRLHSGGGEPDERRTVAPGVSLATILAAIHQGDLSEAERQLHALAPSGPDGCELLALWAVCLYRSGQFELAGARYQQALCHQPQRVEWRLGLACVEGALGRPCVRDQITQCALHDLAPTHKGRAFCAAGLGLLGQCPRLLTNPGLKADAAGCDLLGRILLANQRYGEALEVYAMGTKLSPGDFFCLYGMGLAHLDLDQRAAARSVFLQATCRVPAEGDLLWDYGVILLELDLPDAAVAQFRQLVQLAPDNWLNWQELSQALIASGQGNEAVLALRHALALDPGLLAPDVQLGDLLVDLGRFDEALSIYRLAVVRPVPRGSGSNLVWRAGAYMGIAHVLEAQNHIVQARQAHQCGLNLDEFAVEKWANRPRLRGPTDARCGAAGAGV